MNTAPPSDDLETRIRAGCHGLPPVSARLEPWHVEICSRPGWMARELDRHGSPLHLHHPGPFRRNVDLLRDVAQPRGVELEIFFARKANRCLLYVDEAGTLGVGVDVASQGELVQSLERGIPPRRLVCTAAIQTLELVRLCVEAGVALVVDHEDGLDRVAGCAREYGVAASVILRVSGFPVEGVDLTSRFGFHPSQLPSLGATLASGPLSRSLSVTGVHFHLDGYDAAHRLAALASCLPLVDQLRAQGHPVTSLDMGGGIPMSYVDDGDQWSAFRRELERALRGERPPVTQGNHGLGLHVVDGRVVGELGVYPYHQQPVGPAWLAGILDAPLPGTGEITARALSRRHLTLRMEPGRSLLDGCGLTVARVEHRKRHMDGHLSVGLCMNRSQCATAKPDHSVDPLLLPVGGGDRKATPSVEGHLTGAYCTESDFITWRRLRFPHGVARGDLVVFPNTAGYLMHFVESRSHQFPLARNLVVQPDLHSVELDSIEGGTSCG